MRKVVPLSVLILAIFVSTFIIRDLYINLYEWSLILLVCFSASYVLSKYIFKLNKFNVIKILAVIGILILVYHLFMIVDLAVDYKIDSIYLNRTIEDGHRPQLMEVMNEFFNDFLYLNLVTPIVICLVNFIVLRKTVSKNY